MALIKCEKCGHMISDKARKCPKCGCPVSGDNVSNNTDMQIGDPQSFLEDEKDNANTYSKKTSKRKKFMIFIALFMFAIAGFAIYVSQSSFMKNFVLQELSFMKNLVLAELGDADAQFSLANYQFARENYTEGTGWYRKAAEQGHADAQCYLGVCYYWGRGVEQNYTEAVRWYRKAAEQGDADAQYDLGRCYDRGHGVEQNYTEAARWYRKAAEQGDAGAQYGLGICYDKGHGVERNYTEAAKWLKKAAEQGFLDAQRYLDECYDEAIVY